MQTIGLLIVSGVSAALWVNGTRMKLPSIPWPKWIKKQTGPAMVPSPSVDHFRDELERIDKAITALQRERESVVEQARTEAAMHAEWSARLEALQ